MPTRAVFARTSDGAVYEMTDKDVDFMARALWGEKHRPSCPENEASAILWTWLQRFMLWPGKEANGLGMKRWGKLWKMIRSHSQPVNPIWRRDGSRCKPGGEYYGKKNCAEANLRWRDKMAYTPMSRTPIRMREYAERMAAGDLPNLGSDKFVDFASTKYAKAHGYQITPKGEHFLDKQWGKPKGWKAGTVEIVGQEWRRAGLSTGEKFALGAGVVLISWAAWRLWR
jgi:hypothetical protein